MSVLRLKAASLDTLFRKHDEDVARLAELEVRIAKEHYLKHELDVRFDRIESSMRQGMSEVGAKIDHLTAVLVEHISKSK